MSMLTQHTIESSSGTTVASSSSAAAAAAATKRRFMSRQRTRRSRICLLLAIAATVVLVLVMQHTALDTRPSGSGGEKRTFFSLLKRHDPADNDDVAYPIPYKSGISWKRLGNRSVEHKPLVRHGSFDKPVLIPNGRWDLFRRETAHVRSNVLPAPPPNGAPQTASRYVAAPTNRSTGESAPMRSTKATRGDPLVVNSSPAPVHRNISAAPPRTPSPPRSRISTSTPARTAAPYGRTSWRPIPALGRNTPSYGVEAVAVDISPEPPLPKQRRDLLPGSDTVTAAVADDAVRRRCGRYTAAHGVGSTNDSPIDSVVWLTFTVPLAELENSSETRASHSGELIRSVASRMLVDAMSSAPDDPVSEFHQFFSMHDASLLVADSAAHASTAFPPSLQDLRLDVVYTYVNNSSPSHLRAVSGDKNAAAPGSGPAANSSSVASTSLSAIQVNDPTRFRDWNELLYSMRNVYRFGVCGGSSELTTNPERGMRCRAKRNREADRNRATSAQQNTDRESDDDADSPNGEGMVRTIHIVVADADQTPTWLNEDHRNINIVTHKDIFPPEDWPFLPTFNSHGIEAALHRIEGLSRFFVYFNNDMFWARKVSWFDYFRPLSYRRFLHRVASLEPRVLQAWESEGHVAVKPMPLIGGGGGGGGYRVSFLLEPILYFENVEDAHECRAWPKESEIYRPPLSSAPALSTGSASPLDRNGSSTAGAQTANGSTAPAPQQRQRYWNAEIPLPPGSLRYERELYGALTTVQLPEVDFAKEKEGDRRRVSKHRQSARTNATLLLSPLLSLPCDKVPWKPSHLFDLHCPSAGSLVRNRALAQNRWKMFVNVNKAYVFTRIDGAHWSTHSFAHIPRLMDRHLLSRMQDYDFADLSSQTRRSRERTETSLWTTHVFQHYALGHRRAVDFALTLAAYTNWKSPLSRAVRVTSSLQAQGAADGDSRNVAIASPPSVSVTTSVMVLRPDADEFVNREMTIEDFRFAATPELLLRIRRDVGREANVSWHQQALVEPASGTSLLEEKLNYHVVRLDRKRGGYYFCMMKSTRTQQQCLDETVGMRRTLGGIQLFVTVNDDFARFSAADASYWSAMAGARRLFEGLTGHASFAPWERVDVLRGQWERDEAAASAAAATSASVHVRPTAELRSRARANPLRANQKPLSEATAAPVGGVIHAPKDGNATSHEELMRVRLQRL